MALSFAANTTCDVYRAGNAPPAVPDVAAVDCKLTAHYARGLEHGEGDGTAYKFTHIMLTELYADIRDDYDAGTVGANADTVYLPDKNGTPFLVVYAELVLQGTSQHRRVFLARKTPTWPTTEV